MWPLVWARLTAVALGLAVLMRLRIGLTPDRFVWPWIVGAGVLDVSANVCYLLAAQSGALSIVAPVAGLYPVSTVLLALIVDRERLGPLQVVGLGLAATALVLTSSTG
jgi:drug/metabolite transporter (DMT)-like permease